MKAMVIALLLLLSTAAASEVFIHNIKVYIQEDDSAHVEEVFTLKFETEDVWKKQALANRIDEVGSQNLTINDLSEFGIVRTVRGEATSEEIVPSITASSIAEVRTSYEITVLPAIKEEKGRKILMEITGNMFSFHDGRKFALPYDPATDLHVYIPVKYKVEEWKPEPYSNSTFKIGKDSFYEVVWSSKEPFNVTDFHLNYEKGISITSRLTPEAFLQDLQTKYFANPIYVIVALIVVVLILWYRREIWLMIGEAFSGEPEQYEEPVED